MSLAGGSSRASYFCCARIHLLLQEGQQREEGLVACVAAAEDLIRALLRPEAYPAHAHMSRDKGGGVCLRC